MHVLAYTYTYVYSCVYTYIIDICMYKCVTFIIYTYTCIYMYIQTYLCMQIHMPTHTNTYLDIDIYMLHVHVHDHCTCVYIYMHTCMYIIVSTDSGYIKMHNYCITVCLFHKKNSWEVCFEPKRAKDPESTQVDMTNVVKTIITNH